MPPQPPPRAVDSPASNQTPPTPTATSSLWSSSYASGAGAKIAAAIDVGLVLVLAVFIGVVIIQWKRRTGSLEMEADELGTDKKGKTPVTGSDRDVDEGGSSGAGNGCTSASSTTGKVDGEAGERTSGERVDRSGWEVE